MLLPCIYIHVGPLTGGTTKDNALAQSNATFSLLLPGDVLDLITLNCQRKFHDKGNKAGAKLGWDLLQKCGLGELKEKKARRGRDMVKKNYACIYKCNYMYRRTSFKCVFNNCILHVFATSQI